MSQDQIKSPENFDVNQGRIRLATTIISGHTFKHLYLSGLRSAILPVMATSLGLSNTTIGALNTVNQATNGVTTVGAGYLGDRNTNRSDNPQETFEEREGATIGNATMTASRTQSNGI